MDTCNITGIFCSSGRIGNSQIKGDGLTGSQIQLVIGAVVGIVRDRISLALILSVVDKDNAAYRRVSQTVVFSLLNDQVSQLEVLRPAFTVGNVGILDHFVIRSICFHAVVGGIVDPDGIQIEVVISLLLMIQHRFIPHRDDHCVLIVGQAADLHNRNLIQCIGGCCRNPCVFHAFCRVAICRILLQCCLFLSCTCRSLALNSLDPDAFRIVRSNIPLIGHIAKRPFVTVVGIHHMALYCFRTILLGCKILCTIDIHCDGASDIVCQGDDIEAGSVKGELRLGKLTGFYPDVFCGSQRVFRHVGIGTVVAVDVVGIHVGEAVLAGTVLCLICTGCIRIRIFPGAGNRSRGSIRLNFPAGVGYKVILIVDRRCGNHGNSGVVVTLRAHRTRIFHRIDEGFFLLHLHTVGGI